MARNIPVNLRAELLSDSSKIAYLIKVTRPDGNVLAMTTHSSELLTDIDQGGNQLYLPDNLVELSAISSKLSTLIDDLQLEVIIDGVNLVANDIRKGLYAGSDVKIAICDWSDLTKGVYLHSAYELGDITLRGSTALFEVRGIESRLELDVSVALVTNCRHQLGDAGCKVVMDTPSDWISSTAYAARGDSVRDDSQGDLVIPTTGGQFWFRPQNSGISDGFEPVWPVVEGGTVVDNDITWEAIFARRLIGTVDTVTSLRQWTATGIDQEADFWTMGAVEWLTGDNAGLKQRVASDDGVGGLTSYSVAFSTIQVGDTFEIIAGCQKRIVEDCSNKFFNTWNYGGFPHVASETITSRAPR